MKTSLLKSLSLAWLISAAGCTHAGAGAGPTAGVPPAGGHRRLSGTPVPSPAPSPTAVTWDVFARYLVANMWPHAVIPLDEESFAHVPPMKEDLTPESAVDLHVGECLGPIYKGFGLLDSPDQRLLDAGCEAVRELPSLVESLRAHLKSATLRHPEDATGMVGARLRLLRHTLALATAEDPDLKAAVCQRFSDLIVDCS